MTSIFLDADSSFLERNSASTSTGGGSSSSASAAAAVAFSQSLLNSIAHAAAASVSSSSAAAASASSLVTGYNWYYDKSEFRRVPSIVDGISYERERRYRNDGARFILNVGSQMKLRYTTLATGVVYFHRFYMFHSFNVFPRYVTAACCLFLAGKAEETPKKCKDIIKIARTLLTDQQFATFGEDPKEEVLTMERIVLQTIRFDLQVEHPYKFLVNYAKSFKGNKEKIHNVLQMAWTFTNDSLCTTINLQWEPEIVAIAMLFLASKIKYEITDWDGRLPHHKYWWDMYVEDLSVELLEDVCHQVLDLYQRPQNPGRPMDSPMHSPAGAAAAIGAGLVGPIPNNNNHHPINSHTLNNNIPNSTSNSSLQPPIPPSTGLSTDPTTSALQPPPPPPPPRAPIPPPNVTNPSVYVGQPPPPPQASSLSATAQQQRFGLIGTGANSSMINSQANSLNSLPPPPPPPIPPQWDPNIASFYHHQPQGYNFPFPGGPGVPPQHPGVPNAQMMQSMGGGGGVMQHSRHQLHPHHSHPPQPHHPQMGARLQQQHPPPPPPPQPPMMPNLPASFLQQNQRN